MQVKVISFYQNLVDVINVYQNQNKKVINIVQFEHLHQKLFTVYYGLRVFLMIIGIIKMKIFIIKN